MTICRGLASHEAGLPLQQVLGDPPHCGPALTQPGKEEVTPLDPFRHLVVRSCYLPVQRIDAEDYAELLENVDAEPSLAVRRPYHCDVGSDADCRPVILCGALVQVWTRMKLTADELAGYGHLGLSHAEPPGNRAGCPARQCFKMIINDRLGQ